MFSQDALWIGNAAKSLHADKKDSKQIARMVKALFDKRPYFILLVSVNIFRAYFQFETLHIKKDWTSNGMFEFLLISPKIVLRM